MGQVVKNKKGEVIGTIEEDEGPMESVAAVLLGIFFLIAFVSFLFAVYPIIAVVLLVLCVLGAFFEERDKIE